MSTDSQMRVSQDANGAAPVESKPDVHAIMAEIRARVKAGIERQRDAKPPLKSYAAHPDHQASRQAGELLTSEDLRYLNEHHAYPTSFRLDTISSHRTGLIGRIVVRAKVKLARMLRQSIFADYFASEQDFLANVVRYLNDVSKYVDARDGAIFWELIRKLDHDIGAAMQRIERIYDEQVAAQRTMEKELTQRLHDLYKPLEGQLADVQARLAQQAAQLQTLDSVARGLEGLVARSTVATPSAGAEASSQPLPTDASYVLLENRYRGSEEEITRRLAIYPPLFNGQEKPVVEIGPGRGELLSLLGQAGVKAYGVECDSAMVEAAQARGHQVITGDGIAHLTQCADQSVGGVIAVQVVEHLRMAQLRELLRACARVVVPGGKVIFETVNPQSLTALSSNYFRDPTHVWPLHPDTLSYAMTLAGLRVVEIRKLSPVPAEAQLRLVPQQDFMTPRWRETVELINHNLQQLNDLMYGYQDYCVIAEVP